MDVTLQIGIAMIVSNQVRIKSIWSNSLNTIEYR